MAVPPVEPTDGAGAAALFQKRTGIALASDPVFRRAVDMAIVATVMDAIVLFDEWAEPIRVCLRCEGAAPPAADLLEALPAELGITPALGINGKDSAGGDVHAELVSFMTRVRRGYTALRDDLTMLQSFRNALEETRRDPHGREGPFVEARSAHRPPDEAKLRFTRRLDHEWRKAGRAALGATDLGLAAVYLGMDNLDGGMKKLTDRWSVQLRRDKALTQRRVAAGESRREN